MILCARVLRLKEKKKRKACKTCPVEASSGSLIAPYTHSFVPDLCWNAEILTDFVTAWSLPRVLQGGGGGDEAGHQDDQNLQHHTAPATRNFRSQSFCRTCNCNYWEMRNFFSFFLHWLLQVVATAAMFWLSHLTNCKGMKGLCYSGLIDLFRAARRAREIVFGNFCCPETTLQAKIISERGTPRHTHANVHIFFTWQEYQ